MGGGADDPDAGGAGELDQGGAHSAVGAVDDDGLPGLDGGLAVQHLPRGQAVDHECFRLGRVDPARDGYEVGGGDQGVAGPAAGLGQGRHAGADLSGVDARADRGDGADQVVAGDERKLGLAGVAVAPHRLLGERHAAGLDSHHRLTGRRRRKGAPAKLQTGGLHDSREHDLGGDDRRGRGGAGARMEPDDLLLALTAWTRMHGIISLEIEGVFEQVGVDPARLYTSEIDHLMYRRAGHRAGDS